MLSDGLQKAVVLDELKRAALTSPAQQLPATVREKDGVNGAGKAVHYYLNYASEPARFSYAHGAGTDLLTGKRLAQGDQVQVGPWDAVIAEEQ